MKRRSKTFFVEDIFVAKVVVFSSFNHVMVTQFFLVTKELGMFYEVFSGVEIPEITSEMESDTPYVESVQSLKVFLEDENANKYIDGKDLISLIAAINAASIASNPEDSEEYNWINTKRIDNFLFSFYYK